MRKPGSVKGLEAFGRVRLSRSFFMRDFLYSEIASLHGLDNIPDDPELAIRAGTQLCEQLLEPLQARFGRLSIRSGLRSAQVNALGNARGHNCASNATSAAVHIWDRRNEAGHMGATACIIVNAFIPYYEATGHWEAMALWVHDHLPYQSMEFFPRFAAFNLTWREGARGTIHSWIPPRRGTLTKPGMANHDGRHEGEYAGFLASLSCFSP